jgi:hypothetical protein
MKLDKVNVDIYLHILSIIKLYEEGFAVIPLSNEEYTNILKIIETIRIPIEEKINFKNIIQKIE